MPFASASSAGAASSAPSDAADWPKPPFRLRVLVLLAFVGGVSLWLYPRAVAAWQVHGLATALADYAACMAGPTGPGLIRTSALHEFDKLVRRRLVSAAPGEVPFGRCSKLARKLSDSGDVERAHQSTAVEFQEYGVRTDAALTLDALRVNPEPVIEQSRLAWPFVRDGYTALVHTSLDVKEAMHPVAPVRPGVGRGLPGARSMYRSVRTDRNGWVLAQGRGERMGAYRSSDNGLTWKAWPAGSADGAGDRCPIDADGRGFALGTSLDGATTTVVSLVPGREPVVAPLGTANHAVVAAACDAGGLVVLTKAARERAQSLWFCEHERPCTKLSGPNLPGLPNALDYVTDVARVSNATVLAFGMGKIVRVASSRDAGRTWTPFTVAYDEAEYTDFDAAVRVPSRLLTIGKRLMLYGAAQKSSQSYAVLVSDDQGASFRTP